MSELQPLYEIAGNYRALLDLDIPEEQLADTLELVEGEFKDKGRQIGFVLESMAADQDALQAHLDKVKARLDAVKARQKRLKDYLQQNMEATGIVKIEGPYFSISLQKSQPAVVVDDESLIPDDYCEFKRSPKKILIKTAIADGYEIPGCHLEASNHVRIR
jgi:hypothetical protein